MSLAARWYTARRLDVLRRMLADAGLDPASVDPRGEAGLYGATILDRAEMRGERRAVEDTIDGIDWGRI